ncbi:hypothetical protein OG381_45000 [Streptomyces sp. NBC_00490]|uniref:hypothetical protein n=1 Tax=Streptomyces sp. NBC_00490 TaxID=2903657 RepID=UPI002E19A382
MTSTAVFIIDVLMLAVSDLAFEARDFRFAALLTLQGQNVVRRGAVGFGLAEFGSGATERENARANGSMVCGTALAASGHRWNELGCHPPRAAVAGSERATTVPPEFPRGDLVARKSRPWNSARPDRTISPAMDWRVLWDRLATFSA